MDLFYTSRSPGFAREEAWEEGKGGREGGREGRGGRGGGEGWRGGRGGREERGYNTAKVRFFDALSLAFAMSFNRWMTGWIVL